MFSRMESLVGSVTRAWRNFQPDEPRGTTAAKGSESDYPDTSGDSSMPGLHGIISQFYNDEVALKTDRLGIFAEYDEMDEESPEFASALNIYADNATRGDTDEGGALIIWADDAKTRKVLEETRTGLGIDASLWSLARDTAKYGERCLEVIVGSDYKIQRLKPLPTAYIIPKVDQWGRKENPAYTQVSDDGQVIAEFKDWQVLHFANKYSLSDLTGRGIGYSIRKAFKQLRMMEDSLVVARLTRAHNRLAYGVDTGDLPPAEAQKHLGVVKKALRKRSVVDPKTGKLTFEHNPLTVEEDVFYATNKESKADVKVLQGDLTIGNLNDLLYFQQKLFTGTMVPKAYLAHEEGTKSRSVITEQDIQFARSIRRLQNIIILELRKLFDLALSLQGIDPKKSKYSLSLPAISIVDELRRWQTEQLKMLCLRMFKQTFWASDEWILTNLAGMGKVDAQEMLKTQNAPDEFNGLYKEPKDGTTGDPSGSLGMEAFKAKLAALSEDDLATFNTSVHSLRVLLDWEEDAADRKTLKTEA